MIVKCTYKVIKNVWLLSLCYSGITFTYKSTDKEPEFSKNQSLKFRILLASPVARNYQELTQRINWSSRRHYQEVQVQRNFHWPTFLIGHKVSCPHWQPYLNDAWCSFFGAVAVFLSKRSSFLHALSLFARYIFVCLFFFFIFDLNGLFFQPLFEMIRGKIFNFQHYPFLLMYTPGIRTSVAWWSLHVDEAILTLAGWGMSVFWERIFYHYTRGLRVDNGGCQFINR